MSDISFACEFCGKQLVVDAKGAGLQVGCPSCQKQIKIPATVSQARTPAPPPAPKHKKCPYCAEEILSEATRCRYCHADLAQAPTGQQAQPTTKSANNSNRIVCGILAIFLGGLGIHKFILGYSKEGIIMLCVSIFGAIFFAIPSLVIAIIGIIEGITYLTMNDATFEKTYVIGKKAWM